MAFFLTLRFHDSDSQSVNKYRFLGYPTQGILLLGPTSFIVCSESKFSMMWKWYDIIQSLSFHGQFRGWLTILKALFSTECRLNSAHEWPLCVCVCTLTHVNDYKHPFLWLDGICLIYSFPSYFFFCQFRQPSDMLKLLLMYSQIK